MRVDFERLGEEARVYYYPSSRKFYPDELPDLQRRISEFCEDLEGVEIGFQILYDRFLVFFVSDTTPLSIEQNDRLVEFVLSLEARYELSLLDKVNVCFKQGAFVQRKEINEFKKMIKSRSVSPKTIVFDPMINTKSEFLTSWELPASESWLGHLF
jgi:hypothetical protein